MRPALRYFLGFCLLVAAACAGAPPPSPVGAQPNALEIRSQPLPLKVGMFADFMHRVGRLSAKPGSWTDLFFPEIHALPGS